MGLRNHNIYYGKTFETEGGQNSERGTFFSQLHNYPLVLVTPVFDFINFRVVLIRQGLLNNNVLQKLVNSVQHKSTISSWESKQLYVIIQDKRVKYHTGSVTCQILNG